MIYHFTTLATPISALCSTATWNSRTILLAGLTSISGTSNTLLSSPNNIYFDGYQNMYVADTANHRIQIFTPGKGRAQN